MKKKRKIVIGLIVSFSLFMNTIGNIDINDSHLANSTLSFTTNADEPIGGSH